MQYSSDFFMHTALYKLETTNEKIETLIQSIWHSLTMESTFYILCFGSSYFPPNSIVWCDVNMYLRR